MAAAQNADIQIKPGLVNKSPFYVSSKAVEFKQTIIYKGEEEFLHVSFPMATPWLYVLPQQFTIGGEGDRGVRHHTFKIYVQPGHPSFPKDKDITAEIKLQARTPSGRRMLTIPVYLHDVQPIREFEGVFAIDFGTTSTCCAYIEHADGSGTVKTIQFTEDGWPPAFDSVGSMLYFADHSNPGAPDYEIGTSALQAWRGSGGEEDDAGQAAAAGQGVADDAPLSAFKYSVKRYLGTKKKTYVLNNLANPGAKPAFYEYEQLCALVIQKVLAKAEEKLGRRIKSLVATFPTTFTTAQVEALQRVFAGLGFEDDSLCLAYDEANSATLAYFYEELRNNPIHTLRAIFTPPSYILTFDFGGGTLDIAVIQLDIREEGARHEVQTQILGVAGARYFGGDNISLHTFKILKAKLALHVADAGMTPGDVDDPAAYQGALEALRSMSESVKAALAAGRPLDENVRDVIDDVIPTRYDPNSAEADNRARRHFFELWDAAEGLKKQLGTPDAAGNYPEEVTLSVPLVHLQEYTGVDFTQVDTIKVLRKELDPALEPAIREVLQKARRLLPPNVPLGLAILSGNSSRLPVVSRVVKELLNPLHVHFDPLLCKVAVAKGAAFARRNELAPARIKYKLGNLLTRLPWELCCKVEGAPLEPFYERGTDLPTQTPYVFEPPSEVTLLHVFSRLSPDDLSPAEIGYVDFTRPPDGRPMPPDLKRHLTAGTARFKPKRPGEKGKRSDLPPIHLWVDRDRSIFAERGGKSWALKLPVEDFPADVDPFSGVH